jgi:hypothetical protein
MFRTKLFKNKVNDAFNGFILMSRIKQHVESNLKLKRYKQVIELDRTLVYR